MCRHIINGVRDVRNIRVRTLSTLYPARPYAPLTGAEPRRPARHAARRCRARSGEARERQIRTANAHGRAGSHTARIPGCTSYPTHMARQPTGDSRALTTVRLGRGRGRTLP
jgi:hypothetical protein